MASKILDWVRRSISKVPNPKPGSISKIPGPNPWQFIAQSIIYRKEKKMLFIKLHQNFGEIVWVGRPLNLLFVKSPELVQLMLSKDGKFPEEPGFCIWKDYRELRKENYPETAGLLGTSGDKWWDFRKQVQPVLMRPKSVNTDQNIKTVEEISLDLIKLMVKKKDQNQEINDFLPYSHRFALESIGAIFLDTRLGCLEEKEDKDSEQQVEAANVIMGPAAIFNLYVSKGIKKYLLENDIGNTMRSYDQASKQIVSLSKTYIDVAMQSETKNSMVKLLMQKCQANSQIPRVMAEDAFAVGIDTTGNTLTMLMYYLAINPEIQEKIYHEVFQILGSQGTPTESSLARMRYLKACLKESMRLFSAVPGYSRLTQEDMTVAGYLIPKGTWWTHLFHTNSLDAKKFRRPRSISS